MRLILLFYQLCGPFLRMTLHPTFVESSRSETPHEEIRFSMVMKIPGIIKGGIQSRITILRWHLIFLHTLTCHMTSLNQTTSLSNLWRTVYCKTGSLCNCSMKRDFYGRFNHTLKIYTWVLPWLCDAPERNASQNVTYRLNFGCIYLKVSYKIFHILEKLWVKHISLSRADRYYIKLARVIFLFNDT